MPTTSLTKEELCEHLNEQREWLAQSMQAYDSGTEHEAKRLASTIRTLVHDTNNSHSLLGQLGVKEHLRYWSVLPNFGPAMPSFAMGIRMEMANQDGRMVSRYRPVLDPPAQRLEFAKWWDAEPIIVKDGTIVTRRKAVLVLANKDGGSHIDPELTDLERKMLRTDLAEWKSFSMTGGQETVLQEHDIPGTGMMVQVTRIQGAQVTAGESDLASPIRAMVRQVAHEVQGTLQEQIALLLG